MNIGFRAVHPVPCLIYFAGVMGMAVVLPHPLFLVVDLLLVFLFASQLTGWRSTIRAMRPLLLIAILMTVLNPMFSHRGSHIVGYVWDQSITLESLLYGLMSSLSLVLVVLIFRCYTVVMTSSKFLHICGTIWPKGALVTVMAMRFVPLLQERIRQIREVQRTKTDAHPHEHKWWRKAIDGMKLVQVLLVWSLESGIHTADSMTARAFGLAKRTSYIHWRMRTSDRWLTIALLACLAGYSWLWLFTGSGYLPVYPELDMQLLDPRYWHVWTWGVQLLLATIFVGTPLLLEIGEQWRWQRCSNSNR